MTIIESPLSLASQAKGINNRIKRQGRQNSHVVIDEVSSELS